MKIKKETQALNGTLNKMELIDIYRTFHPKKQITISSQVLMEHSAGLIISWVTNHALVNLRKLKPYEVSFHPQCYKTRYQLQEKNFMKKENTWRQNNTLLKNQEIT